jgi:hypothetical protein
LQVVPEHNVSFYIDTQMALLCSIIFDAVDSVSHTIPIDEVGSLPHSILRLPSARRQRIHDHERALLIPGVQEATP